LYRPSEMTPEIHIEGCKGFLWSHEHTDIAAASIIGTLIRGLPA